MKTIEIQLYKFDELSEEGKQTAIEKERNREDYYFMEFFKDDVIEKISESGFKGNIKLQYSLSYSQGDGLSFCADYFDKLNDLFTEVLGPGKQKTIDCLVNNTSFNLKGNNGRYCYASKSDLDLTLEDYGHHDTINCNIVVSKVLEKLEDFYMNLCNELEKNGYKYIEYENSDECITENLIGNDYDFTENGKMY
jgi:hypothetical protein